MRVPLFRLQIPALVLLSAIGAVSARELTLQDRIAAQEAIERVYWAHRIWPTDNPQPKPPLEQVLPQSAVRAKVEEYLAQSSALEQVWSRPLTAGQLQAEMDRMAAHSRDPQVLSELFAALGDDARLIAETLARQTLADRLVREWYAFDSRFHGGLREQAGAARAACGAIECMKSMGGDYGETTWKRSPGDTDQGDVEARAAESGELTVWLDADEWKERTERRAARGLTPGRLSEVEETAEAFSVSAVLSEGPAAITTATVTWNKAPFDSWWAGARGTLGGRVAEPGGSYSRPASSSSTCTAETWSPTLRTGLPDPRYSHTAVWTGSEMLIWGGYNDQTFLNTGGRYNPSTDSWTVISTGANVPAVRYRHTAVWTGTQMIVWGGYDFSVYLDSGGRYSPASNTWAATSIGANVPSGRGYHTAVWSGSVMVVWGGYNGAFLNTGGRYNPSTDVWTATSTGANLPSTRRYHTAVWSGSVMVVWGGENGAYTNTGGRYNPATDAWTATSTGANVPAARSYHTAVWSGSVMVVWGGQTAVTPFTTNTGGRYNPTTDTWTATSTGANVPAACIEPTAVWSGTQMIVWGGFDGVYFNSGGRYNPATDAWTATSTGANVPVGRYRHTAVWSGTEMIVWGGESSFGATSIYDTGGRYNPTTNTWVPTTTGGAGPSARESHVAVWTGTEMIVWGGYNGASVLNTGGRYAPATDTWTATSTGANVPSPRDVLGAVWTGTQMIVWGGFDNGSTFFNTGGRYNPATNTWAGTSTGANVPTARWSLSAVWTGTEMIVWGGGTFGSVVNTGGRYNPSSDTWTPTSIGASVPTGRSSHQAVWTGTEMIVWGGYNAVSTYYNTGGRYSPSSDTWTPTSTAAGVPAGRIYFSSVWTGTQMVVWGGTSNGPLMNTGGRYSPATNTWSATPTSAGVPSSRYGHTAVWTGADMLVWGGTSNGTYYNNGGRYDPALNTWTPTATGTGLPSGRGFHTAAWTGTQMIAWGGDPVTASGGIYCACATPGTVYRDADGDGYGDAATPKGICNGSVPPGYQANSADCNDGNSAAHPGGTEVCNGQDDDCDSSTDEGIAAPSGHPSLVESKSGTDALLSWAVVPGTTGYDVAKGDLATLLGSGGNFTAGTTECLGDNLPGTAASDLEVLGSGDARWHLVRPVNACGGDGSYDEGGSQLGGRDAEVDAAGPACP